MITICEAKPPTLMRRSPGEGVTLTSNVQSILLPLYCQASSAFDITTNTPILFQVRITLRTNPSHLKLILVPLESHHHTMASYFLNILTAKLLFPPSPFD